MMFTQSPRSYPYFGYLLFAIYTVMVALNVAFMVVLANHASLHYAAFEYAAMGESLCGLIIFAVVFRFMIRFGRFAFFRPLPLEV